MQERTPMKSLKDSILESMDCEDRALLPYLPYIVQDIWTLGTDPQAIIELLIANIYRTSRRSVLDLGCGKGAVSLQLSKELGCRCHGIDGIASFIDEARQYAKQYNVEELCTFEVGDIRKEIKELPSYDIMILGAIGPVFGSYTETIDKIKSHLNPKGSIIIDDAYLLDNAPSKPEYKTKSQLLAQIHTTGMEIIDEHIFSKERMEQSNLDMFQKIKLRCEELMVKHPDKKQLFEDYLQAQIEENRTLESDVVNTLLLLQRRQT